MLLQMLLFSLRVYPSDRFEGPSFLREDVSIHRTNLKYCGKSPKIRFLSYFHIFINKVTVKISLCICVVLSWDALKVRQNLPASDYEIYMVCLLVATVYWHKSLQFVKKSNITLLPCLFMILLAVSMIKLCSTTF